MSSRDPDLGNELGEGIPLELYPTRKVGVGGFGWSPEEHPLRFAREQLQSGSSSVAVLVSVTGQVDVPAARATVAQGAEIIQISPEGRGVGPGLDCSQATLDNFRTTWASLIRGRSPRLRIFDLNRTGQYEPVGEVVRR